RQIILEVLEKSAQERDFASNAARTLLALWKENRLGLDQSDAGQALLRAMNNAQDSAKALVVEVIARSGEEVFLATLIETALNEASSEVIEKIVHSLADFYKFNPAEVAAT